MKSVAIVLALFALVIGSAVADWRSHIYKADEDVVVWANKVGPFHNPQEYYSFFSLPYCQPPKKVSQFEGLGEAIQGYELRKSVEELKFGVDMESVTACPVVLDSDQVEQFTEAVKQQYWYQLFIDDLPLWGMVGEIVAIGENSEEFYVYTHKQFDISYNGNRIIEVNLTSENAVPIKNGAKLTFTYGASWTKTDKQFQDRFDKYLDNGFFEHQIHWFSVLNSFMLVLFLAGLVIMILMRTVRREFGHGDEDLEEDVIEESGWKLIHGDVFRSPPRLVLFSALLGTGYQLAVLVFVVLCFAIIGSYYRSRGTLLTVTIVCYALSCVVSGYVSGGYYLQQKGKNWIKTSLLTAVLFPGIVFLLGFVVNWSAVYYKAQSHIPFGTMVVLISLWTFVCLPLTTVGTILGRNWNSKVDLPCRIKPFPRQLPIHSWHTQPLVSVLLGGVLPFASIFIEMYFLFTSFWHYKYYYVYGFLLLVYIILVLVTSCVTVVSTYLMLNAEDYRWQWTSFLSGASTGIYVYLYSAYYYVERTHMYGALQASFYFGYMLMFSISIALLCGGVAYWATSHFVFKVYRNVKVD